MSTSRASAAAVTVTWPLAWAGPVAPGQPVYYRLQGPGLLIEYDNVQRGANHAHSVWRNPESDFGLDVLAAHRAAHH